MQRGIPCRATASALAVMAALVAATSADAQTQPQGGGLGGKAEAENRERIGLLTGLAEEATGLPNYLDRTWSGAHGSLVDHGVSIELYVTDDLSWAARGGADPGATAERALLELVFDLDTGKSLGLEGGRLRVKVQSFVGKDGSAEIGSLQEVSDIDTDTIVQAAPAWYEQRWADLGAFARLGWQDASTLFAYVDNGAGFLNSSMGYSPTILGFPTYPEPSFGLTAGSKLGGGLELRAGAFDASGQDVGALGPAASPVQLDIPSGQFLIGELVVRWDSSLGGRVGLGVWYHAGDFERFDGGTEDGTQGAYLVLDQLLWSQAPGGGESLGSFLQLGLADPDVTAFQAHVGSGLVWSQPFLPKLGDSLGLGMTLVLVSDATGAGYDEREEVAFELYYSFEPLTGLRFEPDLQYIVNPGGTSTLDDALVLTLRTTLSL